MHEGVCVVFSCASLGGVPVDNMPYREALALARDVRAGARITRRRNMVDRDIRGRRSLPTHEEEMAQLEEEDGEEMKSEMSGMTAKLAELTRQSEELELADEVHESRNGVGASCVDKVSCTARLRQYDAGVEDDDDEQEANVTFLPATIAVMAPS